MNKIWCFYHSSDFDGKCSGAIVKKFCLENKQEVELVGINYGDEFPWTDIKSEDTVYMVDFGLQPFNDMVILNDFCNLIWIDHHNTVIKNIKNSDVFFQGIQRNGIGACALVWEYLYNTELPYGVELLAEYDVWNHTNPDTLPFQYGLRLEDDTNSESITWLYILKENKTFVHNTINYGKIVMNYDDNNNKIFCESYSFETEINGMKAIAINKGICSSRVFESVWDNEKYDCMLTFCRGNNIWNCSIYTDKEGIDVSETAIKYGGGGHVQASGFQCEKLPFKI